MVNLHHSGEDTVVVLAEKLGDNHLEDSERSSNDDIIKLSRPLVFLYSCGIGNWRVVYTPAQTSKKSGNKLLA